MCVDACVVRVCMDTCVGACVGACVWVRECWWVCGCVNVGGRVGACVGLGAGVLHVSVCRRVCVPVSVLLWERV